MIRVRCLVTDARGKKKELIREGFCIEDIMSSFSGSGLYLVKYDEVADTELRKTRKSFSSETVISFTEIISSLLSSGLTLQHALRVYEQIGDSTEEKELGKSLRKGIERGGELHSGLELFSSSFSPLYISMVRLGEKTGFLSLSFKRMAEYLTLMKGMRTKIVNAMLYPMIVLILGLCGCAGIVMFVLPRMNDILRVFSETGGTEVSTAVARVYRSLLWFVYCVLVFVFAILFLLRLRKRNEGVALALDRFVLRIPAIGKIVSYWETLNFSFSMEMLVTNGFSVPVALRESARCVSNRSYRIALEKSYEMLERGNTLSSALLTSPELPAYVGTWVAVAEETGSIASVFTQIRTYFQACFDDLSNRMMNLLEPAMILAVGSAIMVMVIEFVLPIFSMYRSVL